MRKATLVIRCAIESVLGAFMLIGALLQLHLIFHPDHPILDWNDFLSNFTGVVLVLALLAVCGVALCRDSLKVFRRIRTLPQSALNGSSVR